MPLLSLHKRHIFTNFTNIEYLSQERKLDDYLTSEFGEHTFFRHLFKNSSDDKIRLEIYEDNENFRLSSLRIAKYFCVFHKSMLNKFRRNLGLLSESYTNLEFLEIWLSGRC